MVAPEGRPHFFYNNTENYIMALAVSMAGLEDIDDTSGIETVWIIHN